MIENRKLPPWTGGHWKGVPMNSIRYLTIQLNKTRTL